MSCQMLMPLALGCVAWVTVKKAQAGLAVVSRNVFAKTLHHRKRVTLDIDATVVHRDKSST